MQYGCEHFGKLNAVMLHRPEKSLPLITEENREIFLFDKVPDIDQYLEEHSQYESLLRSQGVAVHHLSAHITRNTDLLDRMPNLTYLHDIAAVSSHGCILSKMASMGRCHEEIAVREALTDLNIPILYEPHEGDSLEGCLFLNDQTIFIANTERHKKIAIDKCIQYVLRYFPVVLYAEVPQTRRFMHADMVINPINEHMMLWYPPAFLETYCITKDSITLINLKDYMGKQGIDLYPISDSEQQKWGCSFVPLEPGSIINYDISLEPTTIQSLEREGIKFHHFHPDALLAGGGSLRCLTLQLARD